MIRGGSGQAVGAQMITAATGAAFAGAVTVYVTIDAGVQALGSVGAGVCVAEGNGYYSYLPAAAETNGALLAFTFIGAGAIPATIQIATITAVQAAALQGPTSAQAVPVLTIVKDAAYGHNLYVAGASIKPADADLILVAINTILDDWGAERRAIYVDRFDTFVTTPALQPHTIGPTGVWVLPVRPVAIESAAWVAASGSISPITVHTDPRWWDEQQPYASAGGTDGYYAPEMPNGKLYFVGIPSGAISIRLRTRSTFTPVILTDSLELPPGYRSALTLTVMEATAESFGKDISAKLETRAGVARGRIFDNNLHVPSLSAAGLGLPGTAQRRFDARTGQWY